MLCDSPLDEAESGDFCFIESLPLCNHVEDIEALVIYRWNRIYPYDKTLDIDPQAEGFKLSEVKDFAGSSHEKITKEIYIK